MEIKLSPDEKFDFEGEPESPEPAPLTLPISVDAPSLTPLLLTVLTVLTVIFMLHWAMALFIPLMLGLLISYALAPLVNRMHRWRIPRAIGAAVLLSVIVGGTGALTYSLSDDAANLIETLPEAVLKFRLERLKLRKLQGSSESTMESMQKAATQFEKAAGETGAQAPAAPPGVTRVQIENPKLNIKEYFWMGTKGAVVLAGQIILVLFLAYFMLASGNTFRRKLVKIAGPSLARKKITLRVLDQIAEQIQRYLLVQIFTSILVGLATWLAFLQIGLEHAAVWGIVAGVLKLLPYIGPVIVAGGTALVAFLQFETINMALLVSGISLVITSLEGYLLTPWLSGRASRMSPVVIFVSVLFWGWMWGGGVCCWACPSP